MREMLILAALIVVVFIIKTLFFKGLGTNEACALYRQGAILLDVRTPKEYAGRHIGEALNIPLDILETEIDLRVQDRDKPILLHCASGSRSALALRLLKSKGFTRVYNLGGYHDADRFSKALHAPEEE